MKQEKIDICSKFGSDDNNKKYYDLIVGQEIKAERKHFAFSVVSIIFSFGFAFVMSIAIAVMENLKVI